MLASIPKRQLRVVAFFMEKRDFPLRQKRRDRREASAVLEAGPELSKRSGVSRSRVAFVHAKPISRKRGLEIFHPVIAPDLRDDRSRSDAQAKLVCFDDRASGTAQVFWSKLAVDEDVIRSDSKILDRT